MIGWSMSAITKTYGSGSGNPKLMVVYSYPYVWIGLSFAPKSVKNGLYFIGTFLLRLHEHAGSEEKSDLQLMRKSQFEKMSRRCKRREVVENDEREASAAAIVPFSSFLVF